MSKFKSLVLMAMLAAFLAPVAFGINVVSNERATFNINGTFQALGFIQASGDTNVNNPAYVGGYKSDIRPFVFMKMARLGLNGTFDRWRYNMQMTFGPETSVNAKASGAFVFLDLLDASVDIPLFPKSFLRVGQFKVPSSLEALTTETELPFADFSLGYNSYQMGRDVGAILALNPGIFSAAAGFFVGAGRNIPERYLPSKVGVPLLILRAGIDTGLNEDVLTMRPTFSPVEKFALAAHVNALFEQDSRVGHGGMFSQKVADAPLLFNSSWNKYYSSTYYSTYMQVGGDVAFKAPVGENTLGVQLEGNYSIYSPTNQLTQTNVTMLGGRAQVTFSTKKVDFALRYSILLPDQNFPNSILTTASTGTSVSTSTVVVNTTPSTNTVTTTTTTTGGGLNRIVYWQNGTTAVTNQVDPGAMHEITPSVTFRFTDFFRVIVDVPLYFNMIRTYEAGNGPYVIGDMPGQTSILGGSGANFYERVFVPELRVSAQLAF